jgi:hypothetical protein
MKRLMIALGVSALISVPMLGQVENVNGHAFAMYSTAAEAYAAGSSLPNVRAVIPLTGTDGSYKWVTYAVIYQPTLSNPPACYEPDQPSADPQIRIYFYPGGPSCSNGNNAPLTTSFSTYADAKSFVLSLNDKQQATASIRFMPGNQISDTYLWVVSYQATSGACI